VLVPDASVTIFATDGRTQTSSRPFTWVLLSRLELPNAAVKFVALSLHFWDTKGPAVVSAAGFLAQFLLYTSIHPAEMRINTSAKDGL
jgi:hypothetical protein